MRIRPISEWTLYRLRFKAAYLFLAGLAVTLLALNISSIPPGVGPSEQQSVITSASVSFTQLPTDIVDIPFHALQKLSLEYFGLTPLGIRLPSLIFGGLTALCGFLVLRRWFKGNVAVSAALVILTSAWFLSLARLGAPMVMVPLWTSILLLSATYVSQQTKAWKWWRVFFTLVAAVSLYTPSMVYLFIAAGLASIAQPHLRYLLREGNRVNLVIGGFFFVLFLVPLGWGVYHNPQQLWQLLAIPSGLPDALQFGNNLLLAGGAFLNPLHVGTGEAITPILGITSAALLLIGGARLLRDFHSVRAHVLLIWAALLVPVVGLNPTNTAILFIPAMLVITIGLNQIIRYWYRLFPLNPYARVFAIIPLTVMLLSIVQFNYQRYFYGMLYSPQAAATFNNDPILAQAEVTKAGDQPVTLIVPAAQQALYTNIRGKNVATHTDTTVPIERTGRWIIASELQPKVSPLIGGEFHHLVVNDRIENGLRYWVYQR